MAYSLNAFCSSGVSLENSDWILPFAKGLLRFVYACVYNSCCFGFNAGAVGSVGAVGIFCVGSVGAVGIFCVGSVGIGVAVLETLGYHRLPIERKAEA